MALPEQAGVATAMAVSAAAEGAQACRLGFHAWTPYLGLPTPDDANRYVTWCAREGCNATEQYDL